MKRHNSTERDARTSPVVRQLRIRNGGAMDRQSDALPNEGLVGGGLRQSCFRGLQIEKEKKKLRGVDL